MASAAQDLLLGTIVSILVNEVSSIASIHDQVKDIKEELVSMIAVLQDAEGKKAHTKTEETWVASVRDSVYDVEDLIDEFIYYMIYIYEEKTGGRVTRWFHQTIHIPKNLWYRRQIANKFYKIKQTIKAISERNHKYDVGHVTALEGTSNSPNVQNWMQYQADASLFIKEDELVGIEPQKKILMGWLMNGEPNQTVIPIVGMGGSGKTTLVASTFNNDTVKRHFNCYAWITVSQTYEIKDLYRNLIKQFHQSRNEEVPPGIIAMSSTELIQMLVNYLDSKSYLVVLDDVWDINLWSRIRLPLQDGQLESRVVLTTRKEDIASHAFGVKSYVQHIHPLREKDSWELFIKKAFFTYPNNSCPSELKPVASKILGKCEGLPLAIVALGGLMSSKESYAEWSNVYNSLNWHLANDPLLDSKEKFCASSHGKELKEVMKENGARRLAIQITEGEIESYTGMSQLRSFLVFSIGMSSLCLSNSLIAEFKLLRTLDLENVPIEELPDGVVYLFNLRYLNLKRTAIKKLPKSIGRLRNLQTLNICATKIETLPKGIAKLVNLRHLIMFHYSHDISGMRFRYVKGTRAPLNVSKLNKLQVLTCVEAEGDFIKLVGNMNQLTRIGISNVKKSDEMYLCDSIQKLQLLKYLFLMACDEEEILGTNALSSPSPHLRVVVLVGKLEKVPFWFHSLRNLTHLGLYWSRLEEDLLPYIEALPCLGRLILINSYVGKELCFGRGFVKLTELIWDLIQEGGKIIGKDMDRLVSDEKALNTWATWVDSNVDPAKIKVFFQGVSPYHSNSSD
ncbi:hypothetical protein M0R45_031293 [Rubus argutus]|uniref:Disease resistance protein RPM1-like n=1 Tax=Rubus argutus TaxID=59490 RepID=A0AAW1WDM4_RUBAR